MLLQANDNIVTPADFERISNLVYKHAGINLHDGKMELVRARIAKRLRVSGFESAKEYIDHVEADPTGNSLTVLLDAMSTNLTSFFRESDHFDHLTNVFLPTLAKKPSRRLRAWSAGCSSGEEPYTLAMTLLEFFGTATSPTGGWDIKILATDLSTQVLATAKAGIYASQRTTSIPPALRTKYFASRKVDGETLYEASPALRSLICFNRLNLMEEWPFTGPFDFIFCRNVMIYFDKPTQERLVGRYFQMLDSGGLLFTGHSESLTGVNHKFRYVRPTIYAKP
jgi:chemotaxis protein methyltransferase CheR